MMKKLIFVVLLFSTLLFAETITQSYSFEMPTLQTENGKTELTYENAHNFGKEGSPNLPYFAADILLPQNNEIADIRIVSAEYYSIKNNIHIKAAGKYAPLSIGFEDGYQITENADIYESSNAFPKDITDNISTHFLSGHGIGSFTVCPVKYYPAANQIELLKEIVIEIETKSTQRAINAENFLRNSQAVTNRIVKIVDNPEILNTYSYSETRPFEEADILLITNTTLLPAFSDYIEFKESTGFIVNTITTNEIYAQYDGEDNPEKIRNCVIDYYQNYGISFVILGGDSDTNNSSDIIVPHRGLYADPGYGYADDNIPADIYFAGLDGNWDDNNNGIWGEVGEADFYEEVAVGRICADQAIEITNHTYKLRMYQDEPVVADIEKSLMVGEHLGFGGDSEYAANSKNEVAYGSDNHGYTTEGISDNFSIDELYEDPAYGGSNWPASELYTQFNNTGLNLLNHLGHSSPDYNMKLYNSDLTTSNFTNDGITRGFVIGYSQGCYPGSFDNYHYNGYYMGEDCFAEKFTQLETGEVAFICNSRYGWGDNNSTNGPSQYFDRQFFDAIFAEDLTLIGEANGDSKADNVAYINALGVVRFCAYELNLFGDPSMDIWTEQPSNMMANYPASVPIGSNQISVYVGDANARIAILQNGELIGRAVSGDFGNTTVMLADPITSVDPLTISIIGHNRNRIIDEIVVISDEAYVAFEAYEIVGDANENGEADYTETFNINLTMQNLGTVDAENVSVSISVNDDYLSIEVPEPGDGWFGTIASNSSATILYGPEINVLSDIPDQHIVEFTVVTSSNDDSWTSYFYLTLNAPELSVDEMMIDDSSGDNDGILDAGETAILTIPTNNFGHANSPFASAVLLCDSEFITIENSTFELDVINENTTENATFTISVDEDAPIGSSVTFDYIVTAGNYGVEEEFTRSIGLIFEDFESGGFTNYGWITNWEISNEAQEGAYSAVSTNHNNNSTSEMSTTLNVLSSDEISFYYKVSSEANYDYLRFYIDGVQQDAWAGEIGWTQASYPVSVGEHTFKWEYYKDQGVHSGSDCGWVDYIVFPPVGIPIPADFVVTPLEFSVTLDANETATETLFLSNAGGGEVTYSINLAETTNRSEVTEYIVDIAADIAKKESVARGLEIPANNTENYININNEADMRPTNVTITCDGGSWQSEVGWTIENSAGTVVASGGCPFNGDASLENDTYTVNGTDTYGDGWNGNYLIITGDNGTEYLNWTFDTGSEATTTFIVDEAPPISWLELSQYDGSLEGNQTDEIGVTFNTAGLTFGQTYSAEMVISNNCGADVVIPIALTVGEGPAIIYGDVDGNGAVQAMDASLTLQNVVGLIDLDETQTTAADVDGNGAVQAMDASYILQYVVGLITEFPIEGGRIVVDLDEVVVSVSDFDISTISVGETFTINVSTTELLEEWNVTAFQFDFAFDSNLVEYSGYNLDGLLSDGGMAAVNDETANTISVGFAGAYPLIGAGTIIELEFTKLTEGNCATSLSNFLFNTEIIVNLEDGEVLDALNDNIHNVSKLHGNYPNPFSNSTTISFSLNNSNSSNAEIEIFNLKGQLVKSFAIANGSTSVEWNASNQSSGIYFYKMKIADGDDSKYTSVKKMIILK